jgi:hypothetical protein
MSQPSTFTKPPAYRLDANQASTTRGLPNAAAVPSGPGLSADVSAALLTLQLQHADVAAVANANRLLAARFLANALNDERNACLLRHRLQSTLVSLPDVGQPPSLIPCCLSQAALHPDTSTLPSLSPTSSTSSADRLSESQPCTRCTTAMLSHGELSIVIAHLFHYSQSFFILSASAVASIDNVASSSGSPPASAALQRRHFLTGLREVAVRVFGRCAHTRSP